jgi:hypothetical protein
MLPCFRRAVQFTPVFPSDITHDQASLCISCSLAKNTTRSVAKGLPVAKPGYTVKGHPGAISHLLRQRLPGLPIFKAKKSSVSTLPCRAPKARILAS